MSNEFSIPALSVPKNIELRHEPCRQLEPDQIHDNEYDLCATWPNMERRNAFLCARLAARRALVALGGDPSIPILRGDKRQPLWPAGFTGSISHTNQCAVAAVARTSEFKAIGLDLERASRTNILRLFERIFTTSERYFLEQLEEDQRLLTALRCFSAKEALYKLLSASHGAFLGFQDAELSWDPEQRLYQVNLLGNARNRLPTSLKVHSSYNSDFVFSATWLGQFD